jgi:hypothetical protein
LARDIDDIRSRDGIRRAVVDVLRELGMLPPGTKRKPKITLVESDPDESDS